MKNIIHHLGAADRGDNNPDPAYCLLHISFAKNDSWPKLKVAAGSEMEP